jgi:hypothetical protein
VDEDLLEFAAVDCASASEVQAGGVGALECATNERVINV